jgi:hypothetical protein
VQFQFEDGEFRLVHLKAGNDLSQESFPDKFDLINSQADVSQAEDAFRVRRSGVVLTSDCAVQIKPYARNPTPALIANQPL